MNNNNNTNNNKRFRDSWMVMDEASAFICIIGLFYCVAFLTSWVQLTQMEPREGKLWCLSLCLMVSYSVMQLLDKI